MFMSSTFQETLDKARSLSQEEQLLLIARLSENLAQTYPEQAMLDPDSEKEAQRRIRTYEAGDGKPISGDTFRQQLRDKYGS